VVEPHPGYFHRPGETLVEAARRVAIDAVYHARDTGGTMHDAGTRAADTVLELLGPIDEHLVDLGDQHFTVTHPLTERFEGRMHECELHKWLSEQDGPPAPPGRYRARRHQPDAYSEPYGVDPWELERVREGTAADGSDSA
jgi:hypothetical protein